MSAAPHTEASMLARLEARYRQTSGNGPAWAFIPHVRNAAGFDATRTIDAIAMGLWPSRGLELHGHEIKVSRSDWLRELKKPEKAEAFTRLVDRWWLVVSDSQIVAAGELPPTWGLMVAHGRGLKVLVQAPELPATDAPWMPRTFLASLLRASVKTTETTPAEIQAAVDAARADRDELHERTITALRESRDGLRERVRAFESASGLSLGSWADQLGPEGAARVGAAVRMVLDGDRLLEERRRDLRRLRDQAARVLATIDVQLADADSDDEAAAA